MPLHEIINILVGKFAGRVKFVEVHRDFVDFSLAGRMYTVSPVISFKVFELVGDDGDAEETNGSKWLTAILRGCVRDDAGNMVSK